MSSLSDVAENSGSDGIPVHDNVEEQEEDHGTTEMNEAQASTSLLTDQPSPLTMNDGDDGTLYDDPDLDDIPTKYLASEMDAERDTNVSSDLKETGNWEACKTEFVYSDLDSLENELGEIYGYYELSSMSYNYDMFQMYKEAKQMEHWFTSKFADKLTFVNDLLDDLELADEYKRSDTLLAICYLIQGCWKDLATQTEQLECITDNVLLMLQCNGFWRVWETFQCCMVRIEGDSGLCEWGLTHRIAENCLNILCTITLVALGKRDVSVVKDFLLEIKSDEGDTVIFLILENFLKTVMQWTSKSFLLKKMILFTRNLFLLSAGDSKDLIRIKDECRKVAGLKPCMEDTVSKCYSIDTLQKNAGWIDIQDHIMTLEELGTHTRYVEECANVSENAANVKLFPWSPKSSLDVLAASIKECNKVHPRKAVPVSTVQKVNRLVQHLYTPLSTFQLEEERLIKKYPNSFANQDKPFMERMEKLILVLIPVLEESLSTMIMVLGDATPVTNPAQLNLKSSSPFIPCYGGDETYYVEDSMRQAEIIVKAVSALLFLLLKHTKLSHIYLFECIASEIVAASFIPTALRFFNRDVNRHVSQRPVLTHPQSPFKGINIDLSLQQSGEEGLSDYLTTGLYGLSWRNTYSHVNLLRIMNKLVKGKPSRILMLRMFNAHNCWKQCLAVRNSLFQQYALKLLKLQVKFMDQEWKRNNQRIISAIYLKVRHRFLEDWIGEISINKMKKRSENKYKEKSKKQRKWPWDHSEEEVRLHSDILSYLSRKYGVQSSNMDQEANGMPAEMDEIDILPVSFKKSYEGWIEQEVFGRNIQWDNLLNSPNLI